MMFFGKGKAQDPLRDTAQPKKRSTLGFLFNPHIGDSIRPIGESTRIFVNLIAMIFAMNGLFPKNHPALKGDAGASLGLSEIFTTAWSGLAFTKTGLPKVLLFFAVAGAIVLSILAMITAVLLLFVGTAHAAPASSFFTAPDPTNDYAQNWITYLLDPTNSATAKANLENNMNGMKMPATTLQVALGTALGFYSHAILIFAAFILFYHLASMVVETAHHGVPMGKRANQIWAPIRLVVAIGLLVPVNSGLNSGQYLVIQIAKWGSGLASQTWSMFVNQVAKDSYQVAPIPAADVTRVVQDVVMMYACEYAYNYQVALAQQEMPYYGESTPDNYNYGYVNGWVFPLPNGDTPPMPKASPAALDGSVKYPFSINTVADNEICGSFSFQGPTLFTDDGTKAIASLIHIAYTAAFVTANQQMQQAGTSIKYYMQGPGFPPDGNIDGASVIGPVADAYQADLNSRISAVFSDQAASNQDALVQSSTQHGWISAGSWFNTISRVQSGLSDVVNNSLPRTVSPKIAAGLDPNGNKGDINKTVEEQLWALSKKIDYDSSFPSTANTTQPNSLLSAFAGTDCSATDPMECIFAFLDYEATSHGVWIANDPSKPFTLGVNFQGKNPLAEMVAYGHANVNLAYDLFNTGIGLEVGSAAFGGFGKILAKLPIVGSLLSSVGGLAAAVGSAFLFLGVIFFTAGFMLAFLLPMIPFMHFFFNTITWVACLLEAIIAVPLIALAHLTPEGEGLPGASAKGTYYLLFSVLLRPVLMVFGLVCGFLIMFVAVGLLNFLYSTAVISTGGLASGHTVMVRMIYTMVYVVMLYSIAQHAFHLISHLPDQAMRWMGASGMQGQRMGDPGHITSAMGLASGYVGKETAGKMQSIAQGVGQTAGAAIGSHQGAVSKISSDRKEAMAADHDNKGYLAGLAGDPLPPELDGSSHAQIGHARGVSMAQFRNSQTPPPTPTPPP